VLDIINKDTEIVLSFFCIYE